VLNKIDRVAKSELLPRTERFAQTGLFDAVFMVSALTGDGVSDLRDHLVTSAPLGPWLYPADQVTDVADAVMAAEITRERIYLLCHQELPYVATVETVGWRSGPSGSLRIEQIITVSRASQRAILLGRGGSRLKQIGEQARHELEQLFDRRVHLFLHVAVES
jgi:GTP-binding protein Era